MLPRREERRHPMNPHLIEFGEEPVKIRRLYFTLKMLKELWLDSEACPTFYRKIDRRILPPIFFLFFNYVSIREHITHFLVGGFCS
jgi:hypothetical protein